MKRVSYLAAAALLLAANASAQPGGMTLTLSANLQRGYANIKLNVTQSAERLPEAEYGFRISSAPMTPETRTFGQLFSHIAQSQFGTCAAVRGLANPVQGQRLEETLKTRAEIIKTLNDSFAFCDPAFASLTEQNVLDMIKQGQNTIARAAALANLVAHSNEMYGTSAGYLRAKHIVPPSTERQMPAAGRGGQ
jgi:hypothetical protein